MSDTQQVTRSINRLIRFDQQLEHVEHLIVQALDDGQAIPAEAFDTLGKFVSKRGQSVDETALWLSHVESGIDFMKAQERLYRERRHAAYESFLKLKIFLQNYIDQHDSDHRLAGEALKFWTQANGQATLSIDAPTEIPDQYKTITVHLTITNTPEAIGALEGVIASAQIMLEGNHFEVQRDEPAISETLIRKAIEAGTEVRGAKLVKGRHLRWSKPKPTGANNPEEQKKPAAEIDSAAA